MEDLLFMKQDKDVLTTIVNELGYDDRQFFLSFSSEDEQHRRFRLMTERVDGDIPLEEIVGKKAPFDIRLNLFVIVEKYVYDEVVITLFDDFADNVKDVVVLRYLNKNEYKRLGVYFIEDTTKIRMTPVEFGGLLVCEGGDLRVMNFGEIANGKIINRVVNEQFNNLPIQDYLFTFWDENDEEQSVFIDSCIPYDLEDVCLNNILELLVYDEKKSEYIPLSTFRYFTSFESMSAEATLIREANVAVRVNRYLFRGHLDEGSKKIVWETAGNGETAKEYFEFGKKYWKNMMDKMNPIAH